MSTDETRRPFIDGAFAGDGEIREVRNPATGDVVDRYVTGSADDVDRAVDAARTASWAWRTVDPVNRADILYEMGDVLEGHADDLIRLETLENGKPRSQAANDVTGAIKYCRFYGGTVDKFYGDAVLDSPGKMAKKVYEPYGVVGVVIPWNWPPLHTIQFAALALATGNTIVLKPAPETPLSSLAIADLLSDVLPPGVFNVVPGGAQPGRALTSHADIDMLAFTGNDRTGEHVLEAAAEHITPTMMELGGKNAEIVFPDADLDKAVSGAIRNGFYNSGQACSDTERLLLHADIRDEFLDRYGDAVAELDVGYGLDNPQIGPMISAEHREKVQGYVDAATAAGARVVASASVPTADRLADGHWVAPTVLDGVERDAPIAQEEVFGPVVSVFTFEEEAEAYDLANDVEFGLTAAVWTRDLERAHRAVSRLEAGTVAVNNRMTGAHGLPFGGYKRSGIGRKSDFLESMRQFSRVKSVHMDFETDEFLL